MSDDLLHLLHRAGQIADELFLDQRQGRVQLTPRQYQVLKTVGELNGPSQADLVKATGIDRSTVADLIRRLIKLGFVVRRRRSSDVRCYVVKLTPIGEAELRAGHLSAKLAGTALVARVSPRHRAAFVQGLQQIVAHGVQEEKKAA